MVGPFLKKCFKRILFWFDIFWLKNWKPQKYFCKKLFNLITRQVSEWKAIWSKFMIHVCPIKPLTRLHKWWGQVWFNNNNKINTGSTRGSGCDSVGRAVASDSRGPRFKSSHPVMYWKDENKEKKARNCPFFFKKNVSLKKENYSPFDVYRIWWRQTIPIHYWAVFLFLPFPP